MKKLYNKFDAFLGRDMKRKIPLVPLTMSILMFGSAIAITVFKLNA